MSFNLSYPQIIAQIDSINPVDYARSRNFHDGAVTRLSPYISRGIISVKTIFDSITTKEWTFYESRKFLQELAWREYWQRIWEIKDIFSPIKKPQEQVFQQGIPEAILRAETGIDAIDNALNELYQTGYMHNHMRMYVAMLIGNIAKCDWQTAASWMYYHLLDGDLASNHLSWQWVVGANANKKYYANQENINKYFGTAQTDTFLDVGYEDFETLPIPEYLKNTTTPDLQTTLPQKLVTDYKIDEPTLIYNYYNLDSNWRATNGFKKILLIEPSIFEKHPISSNSMKFMLNFNKNNIGAEIVVSEFNNLKISNKKHIYYKEHPLNFNYTGNIDERDWIFNTKGYFPSFFTYWKKCKKERGFNEK